MTRHKNMSGKSKKRRSKRKALRRDILLKHKPNIRLTKGLSK